MIDTDKYETKKKRNWKLKVTHPDIDNSVEAFNGYDTDMVAQGYEDIIAVDSLGRERYTVAQMVDTGWEDAQLIADAPLLLEEVKRLREKLSMWEDWFKQGADNSMEDGDVWDIIFHQFGNECLSDCEEYEDSKCWGCQTKELKEMIE